MALTTISNGDSGASVRATLDTLISLAGTNYPFGVGSVVSVDTSGKFSQFSKSGSVLRPAAMLAGSLPSVMSSPPSFARSTTETLTQQFAPFVDPTIDDSLKGFYDFVPSAVRRFSTSFPDDFTLIGCSVNQGSTVSLSTSFCNDLAISFLTDAPAFEVVHKGVGADTYRMLVDGQLISATAESATTNDGNFYVDLFTFSSRSVRLITLRVASNFRFTRVNVDTISRLWKPTRFPNHIRCVVMGDSIAQGTGATNADTSFAQQIGYFLGWEIFDSGVGGTGYLASASGTAMKFRDRFTADVTAYSPDVIIFAGGINDSGSSGASIQAEATTLFAQALSENPLATVFVFGPWTGPSSVTPSAVDTALRAAVVAQAENGTRIFYLETMSDPAGAWQFGTGHVGATTGDGNADVYIGSDGIHPVQAGHDYLTRRCVESAKAKILTL